MSSNTEDEITVRVTKKGQATIPKRFRDALGVETPGRVRFRETEEGVVVEPVEHPSAFRGFARDETDRSATDLLRESRERDAEREERLRAAAGVDEGSDDE